MLYKCALCFGLLLSAALSLAQSTNTLLVADEDSLFNMLRSAQSVEEAKRFLESNRSFVTANLCDRVDTEAARLDESNESSKSSLLFEVEREIATYLNDNSRLARSHFRMGNLFQRRREYARAIASYLAGRQTLIQSGTNNQLLVDILNAVSDVHSKMDDYVRARQYAQESLQLAVTLQYRPGVAFAQFILGQVSNWEGDYDRALGYLEPSLEIFIASNHRINTARVLIETGGLHRARGNYLQAFHYFNRALELSNTPDQRARRSAVLTNLSVLYADQGDYQRASEHLNQSLQIARELGDEVTVAINLLNLGAIEMEQGNNERALSKFQESLRVAERLNSKALIAAAHGGLGGTYRQASQYSSALTYLNQSLRIAEEIEYRPRVAAILWEIAGVYHAMGDQVRALEFAERAITLANLLNLPEISYLSLTLQGKAYFSRREYGRAAQSWQQAIGRIEHLQTNVAGGEYAQQRFFENKLGPYHGMINLLIEQNNLQAAFVYAERAKARVLLDVLRRGRVDTNRVLSAAERAEEGQMNAEMRSLNTQLFVENQRQPVDVARIGEMEERLRRVRSEYEGLQIRLFAAHPELAAQRGQIAPLTIEQTSEVIPPSTAVLEYVVTENRTYLFALTKPEGAPLNLQVYPINITARQLASRVAAFHRQVSERNLNVRQSASEIYELLVRPAERQIAGSTTLCVVPDGPLWEMPLQALRRDSRYLIEDYSVFYVPSLAVLREMQQDMTRSERGSGEASGRRLLAFGNPSLSPEVINRVSDVRGGKRLVPLPEAENEVRTLGGLFGAARSRVYTGREAREERFRAEAGSASVIHIASHGLLDDTNPMYSYVLLAQGVNGDGEDGLLEAREIMNMDLDADLVVLSACETARGRVANGEGVIGMTWALFVAGCPTIVASQWNVESASTSRLMIEFYRHTARLPSSSEAAKATALRQASLGLLASGEYNHPFYWAGFVLVGDPR